jgi:hypothetical protein
VSATSQGSLPEGVHAPGSRHAGSRTNQSRARAIAGRSIRPIRRRARPPPPEIKPQPRIAARARQHIMKFIMHDAMRQLFECSFDS